MPQTSVWGTYIIYCSSQHLITFYAIIFVNVARLKQRSLIKRDPTRILWCIGAQTKPNVYHIWHSQFSVCSICIHFPIEGYLWIISPTVYSQSKIWHMVYTALILVHNISKRVFEFISAIVNMHIDWYSTFERWLFWCRKYFMLSESNYRLRFPQAAVLHHCRVNVRCSIIDQPGYAILGILA